MIIGTALSLLFPLLMKYTIDTAIVSGRYQTLARALTGLVLLPVISALITSINTRINITIGGEITDHLRKNLFQHITALPPQALQRYKPGDLTGRVTQSTGEVGEVFVQGELLPAIHTSLTVLGTLAVMFVLSWQLALITFVMVPVVVAVSALFGKKVEQQMKTFFDLASKAYGHFTEKIAGMKTVQIFTRENKENEEVGKWISDFRKVRNTTSYMRIWQINILSTFEQSLGMGLVFAFGAWQVIEQGLSIGTLIAFTVYVPLLYQSIETLQEAYVGSKRAKPALTLIEEVLSMPGYPDLADSVMKQEKKISHIEFRNVRFAYQGGRGQIKDLSFKIQKGETIGIVGTSGAGKSTILDLLLKFYVPDQGEILLNDIHISEIPHHWIRKHMALVEQSPTLWDDTIEQNLLYANETANQHELKEAIRISQLETFIKSLPDGLDTVIGERGIKISGGERQRLALARAALQNPDVLLLDEPTSALDVKTEDELMRAFNEWKQDRTVLIVAHRLSTIKHAERILVIQDGQMIESGSHDALLQAKGAYASLWQAQLKEGRTEMAK